MTELLQDRLHEITLHNRPNGNLKYEHQIDQIFLWMEDWNDDQICNGIKELVKNCSLRSKKLLCTVLEPLLHRDYIYHKFDTTADSSFSTLSTFITRELHGRLEKAVNKRFSKKRREGIYRLRSAHISTECDARTWSENSVFPSIITTAKNNDTDTLMTRNDSELQDGVNKQSVCSLPDIYTPVSDCSLDLSDKDNNKRFIEPAASCKLVTDNIHSNHVKSKVTNLHGRRAQTLPGIRSMLLMNQTFDDRDVFEEFPLSLKTRKRHLQYKNKVKSAVKNKVFLTSHQRSHNNQIRHSISLPDVSNLSLFKQPRPAKLCSKQHAVKIYSWFSSWTNWQQEDFMKHFLKLLSSSQLYYMYAYLMVRQYCDLISHLPDYLSLKIFGYLRPKQLQISSKVKLLNIYTKTLPYYVSIASTRRKFKFYKNVSQRWRYLSRHDLLWKGICEKKKIVAGCSMFMNTYLQHKRVKNNWAEGKYTISELQKHSGSVTCIQFYGDLLATGSADKTIRVWRLNQKKCLMVLDGHQKCIWSVQFMSSKLLISCSNDQSIKIWNLRTSSCIRTILGHEGAIWCLQVKGELLASGSADRCAKLWNLRNCNLLTSFTNHPGGVYSLSFSTDLSKLFTGTIEKTVRIWDIKRRMCLANLQLNLMDIHTTAVTSLSYDKGFLLCVCNNHFEILDTDVLEFVKLYKDAHKEKIESAQLQLWKDKKEFSFDIPEKIFKGRIVTASKDGKVKLWNLLRSKPLLTLTVSDEAINCIQVDSTKIVCGLQDTSVKIINFS